jgi:hypothetical protein
MKNKKKQNREREMRSPSRENKERMVKNQGDEKACERER